MIIVRCDKQLLSFVVRATNSRFFNLRSPHCKSTAVLIRQIFKAVAQPSPRQMCVSLIRQGVSKKRREPSLSMQVSKRRQLYVVPR